MQPTQPWRQCLFRSHLIDRHRYEISARLVQRARTHNAAQRIGGCLLFDGQRFCQLIEGPQAAVATLWGRICSDPRHDRIVLLLDRPVSAPSEPMPWEYGYCAVDELECFDDPAAWNGPDALAAFEAVRARADLGR